MGKDSAISWTDHTFNPWIGCTRVSPGCEHCYAEDLAGSRLRHLMAPLAGPSGKLWGPTGPRRAASETTWRAPVRWNAGAQRAGQPAFVFCASLADVFEDVYDHRDEAVVDAARDRLWALIEATPWLVWLLLTKRPESVDVMVPVPWRLRGGWPANAWIGTTVEDQQRAEERLPHLLALPAPVRFVSYEPALGPVDWRPWVQCNLEPAEGPHRAPIPACWWYDKCNCHIDWLIVGGESGPRARPFRVEWARDTIRQCCEAGVPVWMKQMGAMPVVEDDAWAHGFVRGTTTGRLPLGHRAGADPSEWPADLRVQERPAAEAQR